MKQMTKTLLLLFVLLIGAAACSKDEPDGKWAKMKWEEPAGITKVDGVYVIPASGGTYKFTCKNYKPWISHIVEVSEEYEQIATLNDVHNCEGSWYSVKCEGNDVTVTFKPRPTDDYNHALQVTLTAGDIFDYFSFIQNPKGIM